MNQYDYSKMSDKELHRQFRSDIWKTQHTSEEDRRALAQEVENRRASTQGRTPAEVKSYHSNSCYGEYYETTNTMYVDVRDKNSSYDVLDTVYHEGQHAEQSHCVKNGITNESGISDGVNKMTKIEDARDKNGHFYNYKKVISYDNCATEANSNIVAAKCVMKHGDQFEGDKEYSNYLDKQSHQLSYIGNADKDEVKKQQTKAINKTRWRGDITHAEKKEMISSVKDGKTCEVFDEARSTARDLAKERDRNDLIVAENMDKERRLNEAKTQGVQQSGTGSGGMYGISEEEMNKESTHAKSQKEHTR